MSTLNLSEYKDTRIFVIGALEGSYYTLVDFLYTQEFSFKDILILTGDFLNVSNQNSEGMIQFIKKNSNVFSVKGFNEKILIDDIEHNKTINVKFNLTENDINFLGNLPLVIELNDNLYVVNAGYNSSVSLDKQNPDYTIFKTNKISEDDWYNKEQQASIFCFTNSKLHKTKVPGGYNLGNIKNNLYCLIMYKDAQPILIKV